MVQSLVLPLFASLSLFRASATVLLSPPVLFDPSPAWIAACFRFFDAARAIAGWMAMANFQAMLRRCFQTELHVVDVNYVSLEVGL